MNGSPILIGPCRMCGATALLTDRLCIGCEAIREESRRNRAWCALLYRGRPVSRPARDEAE